MRGFLYIDNDQLGEVDFKIIDESMGVIGGDLVPNTNYAIYQPKVQRQCDLKGISNVTDFNFRIVLADNTELNPEGGIGLTDLEEFEEIYVECAGLDVDVILKCGQ
jgi:hypothetical protein